MSNLFGMRTASVRWLLLVALVMAGCAGPNNGETGLIATDPEIATPPPVVSAGPRATPDPCKQALYQLAAFTGRLAANLRDLRPLVVTKAFNAPQTAAANRQVAGTVNGFRQVGLERLLQACPQTQDLAARTNSVIQKSDKPLSNFRIASLQDAAAQRAVAAGLYALLPDVLALAEDGAAAAKSLGVTAFDKLDIAYAPIGHLPPLSSKATPKPTARPVTGSAGGSGSSGSGSSSSWRTAANAYVKSASDTYRIVTSDALELWGITIPPGLSAEEAAARQEYAARFWKPAVKTLKSHLAYMSKHPARRCYSDAYAADKKLANLWLGVLQSGVYPGGDLSSEERQATKAYNDAMAQTDSFLNKLGAYLSDCP